MTTPHAEKRTKPNPDDFIPVNDVPAFGTQLRFTKRVFKDMLGQLRRRNNHGSTKRA